MELIIAGLALIVSIGSLIYTWKTNTKKYELSEVLRKELLEWYYRCISIIVVLRKSLESGEINEEKNSELNSTLYSLIEIGRFYFPNYNRDSGKGNKNFEAYKGNRPILIDLLVETYRITSKNKNSLLNQRDYFISELKIYQKGFTTELFLLLDPDTYIKKHIKNTKLKITQRTTFSESEYSPKNR